MPVKLQREAWHVPTAERFLQVPPLLLPAASYLYSRAAGVHTPVQAPRSAGPTRLAGLWAGGSFGAQYWKPRVWSGRWCGPVLSGTGLPVGVRLVNGLCESLAAA